MLKRLGKKVLPIIMATLLVTSMGAVSFSAVEEGAVDTEITVSSLGQYVDEYTGVKLESDTVDFNEAIAGVSSVSLAEIESISVDLFEHMYSINVYTEEYEDIDFTSNAVNAYLPYEQEGCYVAFVNFETGEVVQVDSEYIDGCYTVQLVGNGYYFICDYKLADGDGEIVEQTLVDENTGVSVTGKIATDSKLVVIDLKAVYLELLSAQGEYEDIEASVDEDILEILDSMDGYLVYLVRNFGISETEGELAVSMPSGYEDCEVRHLDLEKLVLGGIEDLASQYEVIEQELMNPTISDEELANMVNEYINAILPALASEYVDGNYVVNNENLGVFIILPTASLEITADDVKAIREVYASDNGEEPTDAPTDAPTQAPTQAQQSTVQTASPTAAPTTAATASSTSGKTVGTGDSRNIPMLFAVLGTATAAIVAFRKRLAK